MTITNSGETFSLSCLFLFFILYFGFFVFCMVSGLRTGRREKEERMLQASMKNRPILAVRI